MKPTITLTKEELAASLVLCGYEDAANDLISILNLSNKSEADRFIQGTEKSLSLKGYLDSNNPSGLDQGLEQLIHLLVQSKKKIRWIQGRKVNFIHKVTKEYLLVQEIEGGLHTFLFERINSDIYSIFKKWYTPNNKHLIKEFDFINIEMTVEEFDDLNQMSTEFVELVINNKEVSDSFKQFIFDLNTNENEFDNISFLYSDFTKDQVELDQVAFFLPSAECTWYLNYDSVDEDKILVGPTKTTEFLKTLEKDIKEFMSFTT